MKLRRGSNSVWHVVDTVQVTFCRYWRSDVMQWEGHCFSAPKLGSQGPSTIYSPRALK